MFIKGMEWPDNKDCAVLITCNLDGKFFPRTFDPDLDIDCNPVFRREGKEGMNVGLQRILDVLDKRNIKATFFVPGLVAEEYPVQITDIMNRGHEIGCHGYEHEHMSKLTPYQQYAAMRKGKEAIETIVKKPILGFRAPEGEMSRETLKAAQMLGFKYSSSLHDDDLPYIFDLGDNTEIVEIPNHWACYDLPYFSFNFWPPIPKGQPRIACSDKVLTNWKWEFDENKKSSGCFVLQITPNCIGEQGRLYMLENLLDYMMEQGNIWFATCGETADYYVKRRTE